MQVYVNCNDRGWDKYAIDFERIAEMAALPKNKNAEVSITLTGDAEIHKLNKQYRGIDRATNVLSFELGDDVLLGDIYISLDTVAREAADAGISVPEHVAHMVVHGMLHLQGYDHLTDDEANVMEAKEIKILAKMGIKNPYADDDEFNCDDVRCCPGERFFVWWEKMKSCVCGRYVLMGALGVIAAFGFAPFNFWWATVIGIGGAYAIMRWIGRTSTLRGFLMAAPFACMYAIAMFWWVLNSIYVVPELAAQFAIWTVPGLIGIGLAGGLIFSWPFVVVARGNYAPAARPFVFAGTWTLILWLREWLLTGFPWNPIANIALPDLWLANSMSWWGALGLTFVIIGLIACAVEIIFRWRDWRCWAAGLVFVVLGVCGVAYGAHNVALSGVQDNMSPNIRIIQPAQSAVQKATHSRAAALQNAEYNVRNLMSLASAEGDARLVVFPETSYPFMVIDDEMPFAAAVRRDIIIGATSYRDNAFYNSLIVANANGKIDTLYSKSHLVPFGEYRPFGDIIPTPGQLTAGNGAVVITMNIDGRAFRFVPAVCYEIVFSDSLVPRGAGDIDAIVNITNDTWFGKTPGTYQHLDMVRRYAIESGLPVIRANYSGVSAFVAADGRVTAGIPVGVAGYLDGTVWGAHKTLYRVIGRDGWIIIILLIACIGAVSMSALYRREN